MTQGAVPSPGRPWRWIEVDRWGHQLHCAEATWSQKAAQRPEIVLREDAIRATVHDPDAVFFDPDSTARRRRPAGQPQIVILHYVGLGRTHGRHARNFIRVVVRLEQEPSHPGLVGYVHTMLLPDGIEPRLELVWERHS